MTETTYVFSRIEPAAETSNKITDITLGESPDQKALLRFIQEWNVTGNQITCFS